MIINNFDRMFNWIGYWPEHNFENIKLNKGTKRYFISEKSINKHSK